MSGLLLFQVLPAAEAGVFDIVVGDLNIEPIHTACRRNFLNYESTAWAAANLPTPCCAFAVFWSERWESNPHGQLGKLKFCH